MQSGSLLQAFASARQYDESEQLAQV